MGILLNKQTNISENFPLKILVVDDSSTMRRILKNNLANLGYKDVLEACDGLEAQAVLNKNNDVSLALIDWNMPVMNGLDLLHDIKKSTALKHIEVIMVATESEKQNIVKAIKAGAANYIIKPFSPEIIPEKIKSVMGIKP